MTEKADVIVVGAGVHGASIAFHLARRGVETLRVAAKNYAMQTPAADDNTVQAHAHNRSVPFQVL